jgi:hypothetical protein
MGINATLDENGEVDELVEMIDRLIENGDGHLTIEVDETAEGLNVKTYRTSDCGTDGKPSACCQPTEDIDNDED